VLLQEPTLYCSSFTAALLQVHLQQLSVALLCYCRSLLCIAAALLQLYFSSVLQYCSFPPIVTVSNRVRCVCWRMLTYADSIRWRILTYAITDHRVLSFPLHVCTSSECVTKRCVYTCITYTNGYRLNTSAPKEKESEWGKKKRKAQTKHKMSSDEKFRANLFFFSLFFLLGGGSAKDTVKHKMRPEEHFLRKNSHPLIFSCFFLTLHCWRGQGFENWLWEDYLLRCRFFATHTFMYIYIYIYKLPVHEASYPSSLIYIYTYAFTYTHIYIYRVFGAHTFPDKL
jgi:hypothetical protein